MSKTIAAITKLETALAAAVASVAGIEAKLAELRPQAEAELAAAAAREAIDVTGLPQGTRVAYAFGRAEKRRNLEGVVRTFNPETKTYRILSGTGFDEELHTVLSKDVQGTVTITAETVAE